MTTVYVAIVETSDRVLAVAESEEEAVQLAAAQALEYLEARGAVTAETATPDKVIEFFGVTAVPFVVGVAGLLDR